MSEQKPITCNNAASALRRNVSKSSSKSGTERYSFIQLVFALQALNTYCLKPVPKEWLKAAYTALLSYNYSDASHYVGRLQCLFRDSVQVPEPRATSLEIEDYARRVFETTIAVDIWRRVDLTKLDNLLARIIGNKVPIRTKDSLGNALRQLRDITERDPTVLALEKMLRTAPGSRSHMKDRGNLLAPLHQPHSRHVGIIKSSQPVPNTWHSKDILHGRTVDIRPMDTEKVDGFSKTFHRIPYVNSISGTAYRFIAVFCKYIKENSKDLTHEQLQAELNSYCQAYLAFSVIEGFHSLGEIFAVFESSEVKALLHIVGGYRIQINCKYASVTAGITSTANYADTMIKRDALHSQIRAKQRKLSTP